MGIEATSDGAVDNRLLLFVQQFDDPPLGTNVTPDAPVDVVLQSDSCGARAKLGTEWQTVRAAGVEPFSPRNYGNLRLSVTGPTGLYLRSAQLRQDGKELPAPGTRPNATPAGLPGRK